MIKRNLITSIKSAVAALAIVGAPAVMLTSCEDTLEMPSYTDDDVDFAFSSLDKAEVYVAGCYRGLIHEEIYRQYNTGETVTQPAEEALSGSKYMIANYKYDPILPAALYTIYNESYRLIESCNVGIDRLQGMEESAKRNALLGELYTIRAICYFHLIRFYGDVPFVTEPLANLDPEAESTFYPKRVSRDVIYDQVISEMQEYVPYLPWFSESNYGAPERLSRQAGLGILGRIALHAAGYSLRWNLETNDASTMKMARRSDEARVRELYQIADDAFRAIIEKGENHLVQAANGMSGFHNLFFNYCNRNFGVTSPEIMFHTAQYGEKTNNSFGVYNGQPGSTGGIYGARKTLQMKLPSYYLSFDPADTRRDVSCCDYTITFLKSKDDAEGDWVNAATTYSSVGSGKFRIQWCVEPQAANKRNLDVPVLRYSDVLLMYAEAENFLHNGPTDAARAALKQVRERAGIGSMAIPSTQEAFLDALIQERKWEFADEFLLRGDLIRLNVLGRELTACKEDMKALSARTGKYASLATVRLYKLELLAKKYGDNFLTVPYIDITDPAELKLIQTAPGLINKKQQAEFNEKVQTILKNHGITDGSTWYPVRMFEAVNSTYNKNVRVAAGFNAAAVSSYQIGASIYPQPTGMDENKGSLPEWISTLFYGYEPNKTELFPFAAMSAGHPLIDNPNLTQLPGY